ncbi:hypothetical protein [Streptomyces lavenduligriseus]|uniref:Uncharacterized protein n=1 Tax=Streptomyces lavenduligriseus TaxID=67315 RepID=A0ABT0NV45_9ACTN|nr:hypothetical protein [Streptomyces lavenduligriseus]MCL3995334.1 hypothetical protein [Streptomyces lavenduligriseus]
MSQEKTAPTEPAEDQSPQEAEEKQEDRSGAPERQRQEAWVARKALIQHGPSYVMSLDRTASATQVGRDQFGVSGGTVNGNVNNYFGGPAEPAEHFAGVEPPERLAELADVFCGCLSFEQALARLRTDKVVILSGGRDSGRRSAALMLLHRVTGGSVRHLVQPASPAALLARLDSADGYLLLDFAAPRSNPLRESHLIGLRDRLERSGGHLVITVEPSAALDDVPFVRWEPPSAEDMLQAHVSPRVGEAAWQELRGIAPVKDFLARQHPPATVETFAGRLVAVHRGEAEEQVLADFSEQAVEAQIARWLTDDQRKLRDKAFLVSLAVFDKAPYAVAAELADVLYVRLQHTADPRQPPVIPLFDSSREERLSLAHARGYVGTEVTEWGVVGQFIAEFRADPTANALLEAVWNLHPSTRLPLVEWIRHLAEDGRPLVRTRAATATALLAKADFSSAMAHLVEPWADAPDPDSWLTAANALTLAHLLEVDTVLPVLRKWCTGDADRRRWTAIRAYSLLGPVVPDETLDVLLNAVQGQPLPERDEDGELAEGAQQFADALELLLLAVREPVLSALADRLDSGHTVRAYAALAFLQACKQTEQPGDRPLVLHWYADAVTADEGTTAGHLVAFWQTLMGDRTSGEEALNVLRSWVRQADASPESESALAALLRHITAEPPNERRVGHLLRTLRDSRVSPSPAAGRLLDHVSGR